MPSSAPPCSDYTCWRRNTISNQLLLRASGAKQPKVYRNLNRVPLPRGATVTNKEICVPMSTDNYDIIIIGSGPGGGSLAKSLPVRIERMRLTDRIMKNSQRNIAGQQQQPPIPAGFTLRGGGTYHYKDGVGRGGPPAAARLAAGYRSALPQPGQRGEIAKWPRHIKQQIVLQPIAMPHIFLPLDPTSLTKTVASEGIHDCSY